jgi:hypothetical protein
MKFKKITQSKYLGDKDAYIASCKTTA